MADRNDQIAAFLDAAGWGGAERAILAADASFRRYDRVSDGDRHAILMDAPPPKEDVQPFLVVARHLAGLGYSAPRILAEDAAAGFLLLEDLGDATFTRLLASGADEKSLYLMATDLLIDLHRRPADQAVPVGCPDYDNDRLLDEAALLTDWYMPASFRRAGFRDGVSGLSRSLEDGPGQGMFRARVAGITGLSCGQFDADRWP